jgi:hypothetical protein
MTSLISHGIENDHTIAQQARTTLDQHELKQTTAAVPSAPRVLLPRSLRDDAEMEIPR